jgi:cytochrome oxidase assembly protein ShyY1
VLVTHGPQSFWVVTPLRPPTGPAVAVVRGQVADPADPQVSAVPAGTVAVVGRAQPFEGDPGSSSVLPEGQLERLTAAGLALPYDAVPGWVALEVQAPPSTLASVPAPIGLEATAGIRLQNASYAVQWVLFAGFVVFLWWRVLRDDVRVDDVGGDRAHGGRGVDPVPDAASAPVRDVY